MATVKSPFETATILGPEDVKRVKHLKHDDLVAYAGSLDIAALTEVALRLHVVTKWLNGVLIALTVVLIGLTGALVYAAYPPPGPHESAYHQGGAVTLTLAALSIGRCLGILSALLGALGSGFLFKGSFAFESLPVYMDGKSAGDLVQRNKRRQQLQRTGLIFLLLGFLMGAAGLVIE
jgi:hypothetical protein